MDVSAPSRSARLRLESSVGTVGVTHTEKANGPDPLRGIEAVRRSGAGRAGSLARCLRFAKMDRTGRSSDARSAAFRSAGYRFDSQRFSCFAVLLFAICLLAASLARVGESVGERVAIGGVDRGTPWTGLPPINCINPTSNTYDPKIPRGISIPLKPRFPNARLFHSVDLPS